MVVESALEGELDDHLGYEKNDPAGRDGGNSRNGHRAKAVLTDTGPVEITVPRDRDASFEPRIVAKRQRRLTGVDEMVISLSAKGLTHGEICAHLAEVYGAEVSKQTISTITDRVMEGMAEWQSRPLDPVYAVVFIDAVNVKIREGQVANRPIYLALGVTVDGERDGGPPTVPVWAGIHAAHPVRGPRPRQHPTLRRRRPRRGAARRVGRVRRRGRHRRPPPQARTAPPTHRPDPQPPIDDDTNAARLAPAHNAIAPDRLTSPTTKAHKPIGSRTPSVNGRLLAWSYDVQNLSAGPVSDGSSPVTQALRAFWR